MIFYTYLFTLILSFSCGALQAMETPVNEGKREIVVTSPKTQGSTPTLPETENSIKDGKQEIEESSADQVSLTMTPSPSVGKFNPLFRQAGRLKLLFAGHDTKPYPDVLNVIDEQYSMDNDPVLKAIAAKLPIEHHVFKMFDTKIESCDVTPNGKYAVVSQPGILHVIELATQKIIFTANDHQDYFIPFALSKDNKYLAYGTRYGRLVIRDLVSQTNRQVQSHSKLITSVAFNNACTLVATGGDYLRLFDVGTLRNYKRLFTTKGNITEIEFHQDDRHIRVKVDPTPEEVFQQEKPYHVILDRKDKSQKYNEQGNFVVALHPNQPCIAVGHKNGNILLHNFITKKESIYAIHHGGISKLAFTADGKKIVSVAFDGHSVKIWDLEKHQLANKLKLSNKHKVKNFIVTPSNIIALDDHAYLHIWDKDTGALLDLLSNEAHKIKEFDMPKLFYTPTNMFVFPILGSLHTLDCHKYLKFTTEIVPRLTLDQRWFLSLIKRKLFAKKELPFEDTGTYKNFSLKGKYLTIYRNIYTSLHPIIRQALVHYKPLAILQKKK